MTGPRLAQGTVIAGRFRLVQALGRGGMGEVWLAHHTGLDTPCAVKFIHMHVAAIAETRARFEREAKVIAQLRSPHVVQVLDYGECEGMPYIAMEYLEGEDLGRRLKRMGRLSPIETYSILAQVARALSKAHSAGLTHRDLKPENIFLVRDDEQDLVKILDFGIAKSSMHAIAHGSTATGALLGTPSYMSPEQAQGTKAVDWRSDLWSVGVVAFRCLTGTLPFVSEALGDLLVKIIVNPLPVPSQIAPDLPPRFDAWWDKAAARDPAQRFQSAKELIESLAIALNLSTSYMPHAPSTPMLAGSFGDPARMSGLPQASGPPPAHANDPGPRAHQVTPGSFVVPATTPGPYGLSANAPPPIAPAAPMAAVPIGAPGAPGGGLPRPDPTIDDHRGEPPLHATVPGISHTMAGARARRARVGVVLASVLTLGAVVAAAVLLVKRASGTDDAEARALAAAEAASALASASAAPAVSAATASAAPAVEPGPTVAPIDTPPAATTEPTAEGKAEGKPTRAPSRAAAQRPPATAQPSPPAPARPAPAATYNPGF